MSVSMRNCQTQQATPDRRNGAKTREMLLQAGILEIDQHSLADFSIRRVAANCGVSCAAPYKHFKDKQEFIAEIINYVNLQWRQVQHHIIHAYPGNTRQQLVELSIAYVRFLMEKPHYRSILLMKNDAFDNVYHKLRGELNSTTQVLVRKYCKEQHIGIADRDRRLYVIRSLIYGAVLMFDNGELDYTDSTIEMVRQCIDREFDI